MKKIYLIFLLSPFFLSAQTFSVLTNATGINKEGSNPYNYITIGAITYFTAINGINGVQLLNKCG
jgi:hypothetical protein